MIPPASEAALGCCVLGSEHAQWGARTLESGPFLGSACCVACSPRAAGLEPDTGHPCPGLLSLKHVSAWVPTSLDQSLLGLLSYFKVSAKPHFR